MTATEPLQQAIDALTARYNTLADVVERAARPPSDPTTVSLAELGCRPNDPKFDNAPVIQPLLDEAYNVHVDGVYYTSPLKSFAGKSCVIAGSGAGYRHNGKGVCGFAAFAADQPCLLELHGGGQGMVVRDLYFLGNEKCDGIRVHSARTTSIENCVVRDCGGRGILVDDRAGMYALSIRNCALLGNGVGFELRNGASVCCFAMYSTQIQSGGKGIVVDGWRRGATFTAVVVEGQTDTKVTVENARATFVGCYIEGDRDKVGLRLKSSRVTILDSSIGGYAASSDSQITWVGDNMQAGTMDYAQAVG